MDNDIIVRAEQLGHEAEGLHYFTYDKRLLNPLIIERTIGKFERVEQNDSEDEALCLLFKDDTSRFGVVYFPSFIKNLLSGKVLESQIWSICRDRAKLESRIERQREEEQKRNQREMLACVDWEERKWQLACKIYLLIRDKMFGSLLMKPAIREAHTFAEEYKKLMEEEE